MKLQSTIQITVASDVDCGPCEHWGLGWCRLYSVPANDHTRCDLCRHEFVPVARVQGLSGLGRRGHEVVDPDSRPGG